MYKVINEFKKVYQPRTYATNKHKGSKVHTAEPDIPEPSLIEVELAIEKLKGIKLPE